MPDSDHDPRRADQGDHYFTADPASPDERRQLEVRLGGRAVRAWTAPGIFSPGRVDLGTQVLLREVPPPPAEGDLLDLGCGWGPLALTMALASPHARVWAVDVNRRSLDLVARTAADLHLDGLRAVEPDGVPDDVTFAAIWSNPPIRVGKAALHDLLARWLPRLAPDGAAYLVAQRNLGADSLHRWLAEDLGLPTERLGSAKGFRVLRVTRQGDL
ncbi:class I SAM-dependent methyltransferase [Actinotalea fermentans]|uniref:class I SAM-dependent methyltransferase n=1 Tax=Actinotalea fermentans TaxID=43671 RepID=UPI00054E1897|nr:methyltransferase [Actinotalea fermentans]